jgi:hypothetical protein
MMKDKNRAMLEQHLTSINMMLPKVRQGSSGANNRGESVGAIQGGSGVAREAITGTIKENIQGQKQFSHVALVTPNSHKSG